MKTIILNHKSYLSYEEIMSYKKELEKLDNKNINLILMPNLAYLSLFKNSKITIGSQNFFRYNYGSYTGEISLETLRDLEINYTLVGHPERFIHKLDNYERTKDKFLRSINSGFKTILCLGHNENTKILKKELKYFLKCLDNSVLNNLFIAFEPSSKLEANNVDIKEIISIKNIITNYINKNFETKVTFLYGGSVNIENIKSILDVTDGVIIGKASTNIEVIKNIISILNE